MEGTAATPVILLVEDNLDDVLLTRRAFRKAGLVAELQVCGHGEQAVETLARQLSEESPRGMPALVLLDWKLPRLSGREVLAWIREQPRLDTLPVVVLSSSSLQEDIDAAYAAGANSYLEKPVAFENLTALLERLHLYWLRTNVTRAQGSR